MSLAARSDARLLAMFALLSLIATGCGIAAMVLSGTPQMRWIPNVVAWIVGGGAAFAIARAAPYLSPIGVVERDHVGTALGRPPAELVVDRASPLEQVDERQTVAPRIQWRP